MYMHTCIIHPNPSGLQNTRTDTNILEMQLIDLSTYLVLLEEGQHREVKDDELHRNLQLRHAVPELQLVCCGCCRC